ncbi:rab-GTPase-TBC domain-containing protein [Papiliotrema laurentii]|uniref:Rab-GTPase-TBC domain-containing protein n=1 Tax=Papiliotrema laurentii TaxID=5418 RepID=A0AAD9CWI8_PAPLA|nr:rab-GTPase-TBC domain-containing protein [Papiliotrema laurentii]
MSEPGSPASTHSHRSASRDEPRISIESAFDDIALDEAAHESAHSSPPIATNGHLSAGLEDVDEGDIGASLPPAVLSSPSPHKPAQPTGRRLSTHSPAPSPIPHPSPRQSHDRPVSPSPHASSPDFHARSPRTSPSRGSTPTSLSSPPPRFIDFKPTLPSATIALNGNVGDVDPTAPFETIALDNPTPVSPPSVSVGGTPDRKHRASWMSPRKRSSDLHSHPSISSLPPSTSPRLSESPHDRSSQDGSQAGPSTPSRLHAPPAHPHPFPLPPTSPPSDNSGLSASPSSSTRPPPSPTHRPAAALGVKGSSTFEKVISHTRPSWLPPKDKVEDEIHYHQWEGMMAQARELEAQRRKQAELRRIEREKRLAINTGKWEALLGRDFSVDKVKEDPALRKLWFEGAPSHLRGKAWSLAIGNPLAMSKDAYKTYLARARRAIDYGRFPKDVSDQMEQDMDVTLPTLRLYVRGSPMRDDLRDFVSAWVVYRSDDGLGYAPYITHLSAMFLLSSPPPQAFLSLVNLLSRPCLRAFYMQTVDEIDAYYRVFENLQADLFPKIFANCKNLGLKLPESYFRSMFLEQVPFEACCRLWDQIMLDGDGYIFRAALAIFGFLEPRLHYPDRDEIESVLEGRNKATQAIVERERERARLRGEAYDETLDGSLSVFGLHEGALFDWLAEDGWKESRFERLVTREMPD